MFPDIARRVVTSAARTITAKLDNPTPQPSPGAAPTRPPEDTFEPAPSRKKTSDELLREYTVAPTEMTKWPKVFGIPVPGAREVTEGEAAMLDDLGLLRAQGVRDIAGTAEETANARFPAQGVSNGHADAFRHAYANALLTQERGEEWTAAFTTAHEQNPDSSPLSVAMDLHNNEVGRRIARENPDASPEEMADLIQKAVENGEMVVIGQDLKLHYSNEIPVDAAAPKNDRLPMGPRNPGKEVEPPYTV
ncbi:MAG: hypothetical protein JNK82_14010 [Myxococcaceae bacterium]|nr:hypothetical protein [Myxococcaceae bacterium]